MPNSNAEQAFTAEAEAALTASEQSEQARTGAIEEAAHEAAANRGERVFTAAEVADIRKQEKDKLYKQLAERDQRLKALEAAEAQRQQALKAEEEQREAERQAAEEAARKAEEERMTWQERLAKTEADLNAKLEDERKAREALVAQQEMERRYQALIDYRNSAVDAAKDDIMPALLGKVSGETPEEIDASIEELKALSASIFEEAQTALTEQRKNLPGTRVTSPGVGPMEINTENRQYTAQDIAGMSMNEYAQIRSKLIGGNATTSRGMFG